MQVKDKKVRGMNISFRRLSEVIRLSASGARSKQHRVADGDNMGPAENSQVQSYWLRHESAPRGPKR